MIVLLRSRHSSLCGFVALPCDASAAQPGQASSVSVSFNVPQTKRRIFLVRPLALFQPTTLGNGGPAPPLSAGTFFVYFNSGATICHGVSHKPSKFVDSQASLSVCLVQLLPRTTPFLVIAQNCSCLIMMTNKDSLSHATCQRTDTVFSNFTKPNFLSKLRHWLSPSSSSSQFSRFSVTADPHFVHDLRCKTSEAN